MTYPLTVDQKRLTNYQYGSRIVNILNATQRNTTRLTDIKIVSDEPWLEFRSVNSSGNPNGGNWTTNTDNWVPSQRFAMIDNNILGTIPDPHGNPTQSLAGKFIEVRANPLNIPRYQDDTSSGIYTGFLTFYSPTAQYNGVKIKITFILFKEPNESGGKGITLKIRNAMVDGSDDTTQVVFGTGIRASNDVDTLFGEYAYDPSNPLTTFGARWYPVDPTLAALYTAGFGDFLPNDEHPISSSRDIRDASKVTQSLYYHCKVVRNSNQDLVVQWDVNDFPANAELFIMYPLDGSRFLKNMYQGQPVDNSTTKKSFTITDGTISEFYIEYTVPTSFAYTDPFGNNVIQKGWNLLSLPIRPTNLNYLQTYPNTTTHPYARSGSIFAQQDELKVGIGFFLKYNAYPLDSLFAGSYIHNIDINLSRDTVLCVPESPGEDGWNLIGCLTEVVNVSDFHFTVFGTYTPPLLSYVQKFGVWGYQTNKGYYEVSQIRPGLGYWLKVDNYGYLSLRGKARVGAEPEAVNDKPLVYKQSAAIQISDNAQSQTQVYFTNLKNIDLESFQMPPVPPEGLFDVRFDNNRNLVNTNQAVISLHGVIYPISLTINNPDADYSFSDAITGKALGTISRGISGNIEILNTTGNYIKVQRLGDIQTGFSVTNYPNPVESVSAIQFNLESAEYTSIKLYDVMGNEVKSLLNEYCSQGQHSVTLDAAGLTSGQYICRIIAGDNSAALNITVVK
jgi:hypothetical protein